MTPSPSGRLAPTQDEFDAWCQHPVTQFVAEAYRLGAIKQREAWEKQFDAALIPADISSTRLMLKTREDAYRAFLETTLADYVAIVEVTRHPGTGLAVSRSTSAARAAQARRPQSR